MNAFATQMRSRRGPMEEIPGLLTTLGPVGILAAGLMLAVAWIARVSMRLDSLDHAQNGRVPKVESRVEDLEDDMHALRGDVSLTRNDAKWIKENLERALKQETTR